MIEYVQIANDVFKTVSRSTRFTTFKLIRRLAKDFETTIESVEAFLYAASSVLLLQGSHVEPSIRNGLSGGATRLHTRQALATAGRDGRKTTP